MKKRYSLVDLVVRKMFQVGLAIGVLSVIISASIVFFNFNILERGYLIEKLRLVENLLSNEKALLKTMSFDYGNWDKTYDYLLDKNPDYFKNDLRKEELNNLNVHAVWFVDQKLKGHSWIVANLEGFFTDAKKEFLFKKNVERQVGQLLAQHVEGLTPLYDVDREYKKSDANKGKMENFYLQWTKSFIHKVNVGLTVDEVSNGNKATNNSSYALNEGKSIMLRGLSSGESLFLISFAPILSYDQIQKHGGWIVFIRLIDESYLKNLRDRIDVNFFLQITKQQALSRNKEQDTFGDQNDSVKVTQKDGLLHAFMPLEEDPSLAIQIDAPLRWSHQRMQTLMTIGGSTILLLLGLLVFVYAWLNSKVFSRLKVFSSCISQRVSGNNVLLPLQELKLDELDTLAQSINQMILQVEQYQMELEYRSEHDPLTRLGNRRKLWRHLDNIKDEKLKEKVESKELRKNALIVMDLDGFKTINDQFGHKAGDVVLQHVAFSLLHKSPNIMDGVYRLGGDEFALVIEEADESSVIEYITKVLECLKGGVLYNSNTLRVGACAGVYWIDNNSPESNKEWLHKADEMLYVAKKKGSNYIVFNLLLDRPKVIPL